MLVRFGVSRRKEEEFLLGVEQETQGSSRMIVKRTDMADRVHVTFALPAAIWADSIYLVGDFNDWRPTATPLHQSEEGWSTTLELAAGQVYRYYYLINGVEQMNDCHADGYVPFGDNKDIAIIDTRTLERGLAVEEPGGRALAVNMEKRHT